MKRQSNQLLKSLALGAVLVVGGLSSGALAGPSRGARPNPHVGSNRVALAGRITIDGHTTKIRPGYSVLRQVVDAFGASGYQAWIADGRVQVNFGHDRPSVRWYGNMYNARFDWDDGHLSVGLRRSHSGYRPSGEHARPAYRPPHRPAYRPPHRPQRQPRHGIRWSWGIGH
jgi:hypothetical protein